MTALTLLVPRNRGYLRRLDRIALGTLGLAALGTSMAHIGRYIALSLAPVSTVTPLTATYTIFLYPLAFIINRHIEDFSRCVIIEGLCVVAGVFLIFLGN